jgi:hypothetical protein
MLDKHSKYIDQIKIEFDRKFINSLSLLTRRKIEPITIKRQYSTNAEYCSNKDAKASKDADTSKNAEEIIIGIKCPVIMYEETFDKDKKIVESDILKAFADILNSDICNIEKIDPIYQISKKCKLKYKPVPCPICGDTDTIRHGRRMTNIGFKSTHFCKRCDKYYTNQESDIWKMKNSRQVIDEAIELSKQFSLRETARQIREKYNVKISHSAILIWRNKSELKNRQTK